jgi:hypothetical protein
MRGRREECRWNFHHENSSFFPVVAQKQSEQDITEMEIVSLYMYLRYLFPNGQQHGKGRDTVEH